MSAYEDFDVTQKQFERETSDMNEKISLPSTLEALKDKLVRLNLKDGQTVIEGMFKDIDVYSEPRRHRVFLVIETKGHARTLLFDTVRDWQEIEKYTPETPEQKYLRLHG